MRRREFIAGLGAAAWPVVAIGQQQAIPVIGVLQSSSLQARRPHVAAFLKGLAESGFVDGQNVAVEYRWANERYERLPELAAELVRERVNVIAAPNITAAALAAKAATQEIPIIFLTGADPVQIGLVASLNRPGGNLTGVVILNGELAAKRLDLLCKVIPAAKSIAYLVKPTNPAFTTYESTAVLTAARVLRVKLQTLNASSSGDIETAFEDASRSGADALLTSGEPYFSVTQREQIVALAARYRTPVMYDRSGGRSSRRPY
jgi:putative ABC transport system substrate-binding protein